LAGLLAIAVLGVVMLALFNRTLTSSLAKSDLDSETRLEIDSQREKLAAIDIPPHVGSEQRATIEKTIDESFLAGFRVVMLSASLLALLSAATAWLSIKRTQDNRPTSSG